MVFIVPPEKPKSPEKFALVCSECGFDDAFIKEVHVQGSLIFACPGCDATELFKPSCTEKKGDAA